MQTLGNVSHSMQCGLVLNRMVNNGLFHFLFCHDNIRTQHAAGAVYTATKIIIAASACGYSALIVTCVLQPHALGQPHALVTCPPATCTYCRALFLSGMYVCMYVVTYSYA